MHRIDSDSKSVDKFGTGKHGFTDGDATSGVEATSVTDDWLDSTQEEIANVIEKSGLTLNKASNEQLYAAMVSLATLDIALLNYFDKTAITGTGTLNTVVGENNNGIVIQVCGTAGIVRYTTDSGESWSTLTPAASFTGIFYGSTQFGGGTFIAVGAGGEIQTSSGIGNALTQRTPASSYTGDFRSVAYDGAGLYCTVGTAAEIQTSPGGTTWTHQSKAGSFTGVFYSVEFTGSLWRAVGEAGEVQTSINGVDWIAATKPGVLDLYASAYSTARGRWYVSDSDGDVHWSDDDGTTWNTVAAAGATTEASSLVVLPTFDRLFSVGSATRISDDGGLTWRTIAATVAFGSQHTILDGDVLVRVGVLSSAVKVAYSLHGAG